jgi:hypothetical protein
MTKDTCRTCRFWEPQGDRWEADRGRCAVTTRTECRPVPTVVTSHAAWCGCHVMVRLENADLATVQAIADRLRQFALQVPPQFPEFAAPMTIAASIIENLADLVAVQERTIKRLCGE